MRRVEDRPDPVVVIVGPDTDGGCAVRVYGTDPRASVYVVCMPLAAADMVCPDRMVADVPLRPADVTGTGRP